MARFLLVLFLITLCLPMKTSAADSLQQVQHRALSLLLGGGGDGMRQRQMIESNHAWCRKQLEMPFKPVLWSDDSGIDIGNRLAERAAQLSRMAIVYRSDTAGLQKDPQLKSRITETLGNILEHYNPGTPRPGNWFHWQIPIPNHLGATALLLGSDLPPDLGKRTRESLRFQLRDMSLEGVNAAWESRNHMYLALLDNDQARMKRASDHVFTGVRYGRNGGVREDFCYTFHGVIPYAGAYGAGFVQTVAQFIYLFEGTPWAAAPWRRELISNTLLDHSRWFLFAGGTDMHIMGRNFAWRGRPGGFSTVFEAFLLLSQVESNRRAELEATSLALLAMNPDAASTLGGFADRLPQRPPALPTGFRYWPSGEIGAFNTPTFHVGFRQYSSRVQDYEFLTMRGAEGWNLSYGFTTLMRADGSGSWFDKTVEESEAKGSMLREIDMQHLPGATTRVEGNPVNEIRKFEYTGYSLNYGTSKFAGGAGGPGGGVAGFVLVPAYSGFQAHKSLHFFPQGFWALGSAITSTDRRWKDSQQIHTTVLQWRGSSPKPRVQLDGKETSIGTAPLKKSVRLLWVDRVAIVFPQSTGIVIRSRGPVITAWIDHGVHPQAASYAYATLPDVSVEEAKAFARDLPVKPVQHDAAQHAVHDSQSGQDSFVFFQPGTCKDVEVKQPLVLYRGSGQTDGVLSLQDPLHQKSRLEVSLELPGKTQKADPEIEIASEAVGRTTLSVASDPGRVYQMGHGVSGKKVTATHRMDLSALRPFRVESENEATRTVLSVHLPAHLKPGEYGLSIHGDRGHQITRLTEKELLDRPAPGVARYLWLRNNANNPDVPVRARQSHGDFRLILRTPTSEAVDYFTVPVFRPDGSIDAAAPFDRDLDNPARPQIPWPGPSEPETRN